MSRKRNPFATQVDEEVVERVRATVAGLQRLLGPTVTLSSFVTEALVEHIRRAERKHNNGDPFTTTDDPLLRGRRLSGKTRETDAEGR